MKSPATARPVSPSPKRRTTCSTRSASRRWSSRPTPSTTPYPLLTQNVVLLVENIAQDLNYFTLDKFITELRTQPEFYKVRFFFFKGRMSVAVQFKKADQARYFFDCLHKKIPNFCLLFGEDYKVQWARVDSSHEITADCKSNRIARESKIVLPVRFFPDQFYAIILRNLPLATKKEEVQDFLVKKEIEVRIDGLYKLKNEQFCLLIMKNLEACERACQLLNDKRIQKKLLKAHVHPDSYLRRPLLNKNDPMRMGFKEDESVSEKLLRLEELLEESKLQEEVRKAQEKAQEELQRRQWNERNEKRLKEQASFYQKPREKERLVYKDRYERNDSLKKYHRRSKDRKRKESPVHENRRNRSTSKQRHHSSSRSDRSKKQKEKKYQREAGEITISNSRENKEEKVKRRKSNPGTRASLRVRRQVREARQRLRPEQVVLLHKDRSPSGRKAEASPLHPRSTRSGLGPGPGPKSAEETTLPRS